jgi:hypothetical protein
VKIIPYSVLAATLLGGMVAAPGSAFTSGARADVSRAAESDKADPQAQDENKGKQAAGSPERVAPAQTMSALPSGTTICAEIEKSLDVKKLKVGSAVTARTTLAVLSFGKVVIPSGAKIAGHVTEASARSASDATSVLAIAFDHVLLKGGTKMPIDLTIQAIGSPTLTASQNDDETKLHLPTDRPSGRNLSGMRPPSTQQTADPMPGAIRNDGPTLDGSSRGAIGLPELTLSESTEPTKGSRLTSDKKDVKLSSETEIVLRVIVGHAEEPGKP